MLSLALLTRRAPVLRVSHSFCRSFSQLSHSELSRLEQKFNEIGDNASAQAIFYSILNNNGHHQIVHDRIHSRKYGINDDVLRELQIAIQKIDQRNSNPSYFGSSANASESNVLNTLPTFTRSAFSSAASNMMKTDKAAAGTPPPSSGLGTESNPLVTREAGSRFRALLTFLSIGVTAGFAYMLYLQLNGKGDVKFKPIKNSEVRFDDVKGVTEAKAELEEVVRYLQNPESFNKLGGKMSKGVLLTGPPGTGKTMLAKAVAGEAGVPFFYVSASEFEEMFVGLGAKRVRDLFAAARAAAPCIVFIDELDAVGGARNPRDQQSLRQTLNQLLVEMDGFNKNQIIVMGATNFPNILDKALLRPGRFDRQIVISLPDQAGRRDILASHISKQHVPTDKNLDLTLLARGTPGFSPADLANIVNMAATRAAVLGRGEVTQADFEFAKDRSLMGAERRSTTLSEKVKRLTAFHEGGHALVALNTPGANPVHKATILPRGQALGLVMQLPESDVYSVSRQELLARMDVCMGGRVAEEMVFGADAVTTGASSDMQQATSIATEMVLRYGMCEEAIGLVYRSPEDYNSLSDEAKLKVDAQIRGLMDKSYARAKRLLQTHRGTLNTIAEALLQYETLTGAELNALIRGEPLSHRVANGAGGEAGRVIDQVPEVYSGKLGATTTVANGVDQQ